MIEAIQSARFRVIESQRSLKADSLADLLHGIVPALCVRQFLPANQCDIIARNFETVRAKQREDRVPGDHVGAFHYGKTTEEYFDSVAKSQSDLDGLFSSVESPIQSVHEVFRQSLATCGIEYRPAQWRSSVAPACVARSWTGKGEFALSPHEDRAQLGAANQADFEIQKISKEAIAGVNLCIQQSETGGALVVWNVMPEDADRIEYGVVDTGYPYPVSLVANKPSIRVVPRKGDLYCVDGNLLHGVESIGRSSRITLSFLCGLLGESTVIYWT